MREAEDGEERARGGEAEAARRRAAVAHRDVLVDHVRGHLLGHGGLVLPHLRRARARGRVTVRVPNPKPKPKPKPDPDQVFPIVLVIIVLYVLKKPIPLCGKCVTPALT